MKPHKPFLKTNLFACLLAFAAMATFAGLVWMKIKPTFQDFQSPSGSASGSPTTDAQPSGNNPTADYIPVGDIVPYKWLIENCDILNSGETSALCYDRTKKYLFWISGRTVIREVVAPPSSRDVIVEQRDAYGNRTTRTLSPAYSQAGFASVLDTYYDAKGKPTKVPVPVDRPEVFDTLRSPKINFDDMRKY